MNKHHNKKAPKSTKIKSTVKISKRTITTRKHGLKSKLQSPTRLQSSQLSHHNKSPHHLSSLYTIQSQSYQTHLIDHKEPLNIETGPVRVRFAPSPTGTLHLGGLRTALYNLLFVKNRGGEMILRIEDTDRTRLVPGAVESLINDMRWVGITFDEGPNGIHYTTSSQSSQSTTPTTTPTTTPNNTNNNINEQKLSNPLAKPRDMAPYTQSERFHLYKEAADRLINNGHAYHCFCTAERLDQVRQTRAAKGEPIIYDRLCISLTKDEITTKMNNNESYVVRMKMPDGITHAKDLVRGEVKFQNNLIDDQVLLKSDGFPTYHLANIVDDHMMNITHVIRGEEWLPSLPKHLSLYTMFNWEAPQFAHLPLLMREDGGKLSKRFKDSSLNYYVEMGYLPEAIINFVSLLGWHPTVDELQEHANNKAGIVTNNTINTTNNNSNNQKNQQQQQDITKLDPAALKALLTDDKTKLKQKTTQLSQSTIGGGGLNEVFTIDELSKYFNIHNMQKSGATVELGKLKFFHTQHWKRALNDDIIRLEAFAAPHVHTFIKRFQMNELTEEDLLILNGVQYDNTKLIQDPTLYDNQYGLHTEYHTFAYETTHNGLGKQYKPNHSIITALKTTRDHPYTLTEFPARSLFVWARPILTTNNAIELKSTFWINDNNLATSKTTLTTNQVLLKLIDKIQSLSENSINDYDITHIVNEFKTFSKTNKISLKEIYQPLRFAFSGSLAGPGVADQLCAIGKNEAIERIKIVLE